MPDQREQSEIQNTGSSQEEMYRGESIEPQNAGSEREASSTERSNRGSSNRGFAAMSPERQRQIV